MRLFELEAKALLTKVGIHVPRGVGVSTRDQLETVIAASDWSWPMVGKVQVLEGRRGQRGGVRVVHSPNELRQTAVDWWRDGFDGDRVNVVLVEEFVPTDEELFMHVSIDPAVRTPVFLVGAEGGIHVETRASRVSRIPVDPLIGYQPYLGRKVSRALLGPGAPRPGEKALERLTAAFYEGFSRHHLDMLEINPLGRRNDGRFVALDAKAEVDPTSTAAVTQALSGKLLERSEDPAVAALRAFGHKCVTIPDGDVAVLAIGAGAGMALYDELTGRGLRIGTWVDMNPQDSDGVEQTLATVISTSPRLIVIQAFFQLGNCANYARAIRTIKEAVPRVAWACRFDGRGAAEATSMLEGTGIGVARSLNELVAVAATAPTTNRMLG